MPPTIRTKDFPIVAIGASAGGLNALKKFLSAMPIDSGMAFVLIPHLDPTHESLMVELLAKQTRMPVHEAKQGLSIQPDQVYIIPPNRYLAIRRGRLMLSKPPAPRGLQTAIDFALCSLAEDQKEAAVGIILSGTGSHGTLGVKAIKAAGGLVMVQDPKTAEYDLMPRSALATGVVDQVLAPEQMPQALVRYAKQAYWVERPVQRPEEAEGVQRILALLQARAKYDFRGYRQSMIMRRIQRRMALLQIDELPAYVEHLRKSAEEVTALYKDLLIGVTEFFRDAEAFEVLAERVLPALVARSNADRPVRVWIPGCATGEEAYSLAILLMEQFRAADKAPSLQVFATDIDEDSLEIARQGIYPETIAAAVSSERLQKFFVKHDRHHYQVNKSLRESIVFAPQKLISDAPFSRLDLISCRNVLIYFEPEVQAKIISLLHFELNDGGHLLLGPSESIGRATGMFETVSKKWRLYRRLGPPRHDLVSMPIVMPGGRLHRVPVTEHLRRPRAGFTELMQKALAEEFGPASVLINRAFEILSLQGPLVNFLEFPAGEMTRDLLTMARPGLRAKIREVCEKAAHEGRTISDSDARVRRDGSYIPCILTVRPLTEPKEAEGLLLVAFRDGAVARRPLPSRKARVSPQDSVVKQLEGELRSTRDDLQTTIEELESSNEELKASNEEVMSMNEELQSTNEELETSKEELQSLNEELSTVNNQLHDKVEELDKANSDLVNLIGATAIATVFLDTELKIRRFTAPTVKLLNLMSTDVGRPFRDFAPKFRDEDLLRDAQQVLQTLLPAERVIRTDEDHWYLRRILPYRAGDERIGGVVITFIDVTQRMLAESQARRLATVLRDSNDAVIVWDFNGRIMAWNHGAELAYGYTEPEALKMNVRQLMPEELGNSVEELAQRALRREAIESFETRRVARDGRALDVWVTVTSLKDEQGNPIALAETERDITARRQAQEEVRTLNAQLEQRIAARTAELLASEHRIHAVLDAAVDAIITIDAGGVIRTFNAAAQRIFGYPVAEAIGQHVRILMPSPYRDHTDEYMRRYRETGQAHVIGRTREFIARRKDGTEFPIQLSVSEIKDLGLFTGIIRDITEQRALQEEIVRVATLEQSRIGQELHDTTQQELTGLGLLAKSLSETFAEQGSGRAKETAAKLAAGIAAANRHVRALAMGLMPVPVEADGLMSALESLAKDVEDQNGLPCRFECTAPVDVADANTATHLYRIAHEAVTNAVRHAQASAISIRLEKGERALRLEVRDNGIGLDAERLHKSKRMGLRIMEHRCALIGGMFTLQRPEIGGTVVSCTISTSSKR